MSAMNPSPSHQLADGLLRIHAALRRSLETIVRVSGGPIPAGDRGGFSNFCDRFTRFLRVHHEGEEEIVFPKLVECAERASMLEMAAKVGVWRADHEKLLVHLSAFEAACAQLSSDGTYERLHRSAKDVRDVLFPHLDAEEAALDGASLGKLLKRDEVLELAVASSKHGQRVGGQKVLMLLVHSLTVEEQQAHFSEMPWIVRKVLLKRIWARDFRGCLMYAHNPSVAL
jgi:Hemerythrin HHE cation binding domain